MVHQTFLKGKELMNYEKVKNFGFTLNSTLSCKDHIKITFNKVFATVQKKQKKKKNSRRSILFNIKVQLVKTLILSHFNYRGTVINHMTIELVNKLQSVQNYSLHYFFI